MTTQVSNWLREYQVFIFTNILSKALPDTDPNIISKRKELVKQEPMKLWIRAVTDRSYNPNQTENYESPEFLGDSEMANHFSAMVIKKHPNVDERTLTLLKNTQIWKYSQSEKCDNIGLSKFILSIFPINHSTKEDVLEALFGMMRIIGDQYLGLGQGSLMCYNMIESLYGNLNIDFSSQTLKNAKEQLRDIADKLDWFDEQKKLNVFGHPIEIKNKRTGALEKYKLTYKLPQKALFWLKTHNHTIQNQGVVADVEDIDKSVILFKGADTAVSNLKQFYNIDLNYAEEYKEKQHEHYPQSLLNKMQQDDFIRLFIRDNKIAKKPVRPIFTQLIGVKDNEKSEIIVTVKKDSDITFNAMKNILYDLYIKNGRQPLRNVITI